MTDKLVWLYGKKIEANPYIPEESIYTLEDETGELTYLVTPEMWSDYEKWLDSLPLLKELL